MPLTDAINSTPDSGASFSCRCTNSNVNDCLRDPKKTGAGIWRPTEAYGADFWSGAVFWSVCYGPYELTIELCVRVLSFYVNLEKQR